MSGFVRYNIGRGYNQKFDRVLPVRDIATVFPDPGDQYKYFLHAFWHAVPQWVRDHRRFFSQESRGFGENCFHAMWYYLFCDLHPRNFLEIGLYRGQVFTLARCLAREFDVQTRFLAISPFTTQGDSASRYEPFDFHQDVVDFSERFGVPIQPGELCRALSTDPRGLEAISSRPWHLVYIDGAHDYPTVRHDFDNVAHNLAPDGVIVIDDAGQHTGYRPGRFSFAGHPGPSQVVKEALEEGWRILVQAGHNVVLQRR